MQSSARGSGREMQRLIVPLCVSLCVSVARAQTAVPAGCVRWFDGCSTCTVQTGSHRDCGYVKQCGLLAEPFCERYEDGTICVHHGSCVDANNQPVADPSGTPLTSVPVGDQSCSECVRAGKYFSAGSCAGSWSQLDAGAGATCSATHGVAQVSPPSLSPSPTPPPYPPTSRLPPSHYTTTALSRSG